MQRNEKIQFTEYILNDYYLYVIKRDFLNKVEL